MENLVCADIGSVAKRRFAWWESEKMHGRDLSSLAARVGALLNEEMPVALGFESPLYVPLPEDENLLAKARPIDGNRAWSAGAGCSALATGLVQVAWVLESIRRHTAVKVPTACLNWDEFSRAQRGLLLWRVWQSMERTGFPIAPRVKRCAPCSMKFFIHPSEWAGIAALVICLMLAVWKMYRTTGPDLVAQERLTWIGKLLARFLD